VQALLRARPEVRSWAALLYDARSAHYESVAEEVAEETAEETAAQLARAAGHDLEQEQRLHESA
jgi:WhiB family redox-sensing transcriptional regulator